MRIIEEDLKKIKAAERENVSMVRFIFIPLFFALFLSLMFSLFRRYCIVFFLKCHLHISVDEMNRWELKSLKVLRNLRNSIQEEV